MDTIKRTLEGEQEDNDDISINSDSESETTTVRGDDDSVGGDSIGGGRDDEDEDELFNEDDIDDDAEKYEGAVGDVNDDDDDDDENTYNDEPSDEFDEPVENYLQKIDETMKTNNITKYHPQLIQHNFDEIKLLCNVQRNAFGDIVDDLHRTTPIMTKYERSRILQERTVQINSGMKSFLTDQQPHVMDGFLIALEELEQKKIPFIIKRPLPNGTSEYWNVCDLKLH